MNVIIFGEHGKQTKTRNIGARTKVMGRKNSQESIIVSIFSILIGQCENNRRVLGRSLVYIWRCLEKLYDEISRDCGIYSM